MAPDPRTDPVGATIDRIAGVVLGFQRPSGHPLIAGPDVQELARGLAERIYDEVWEYDPLSDRPESA